MKLLRRRFLGLAVGAIALPAVSRIAWAQNYPTKPVRIVVGFAPESSPDILARLIGQSLSERLSQPFIIENRPGGGSNIATQAVVSAPADGYTLVLLSLSSAVNATFYDKLDFNLIRDIAPVAGISRDPYVMLVNPSVPARTVPELIAYAKANPGKINMASPGNGSGPHMVGELFKMMAGVEIVHIPYRGGGPALIDLLAGQVQLMFPSPPAAIAYIKSGRLKPLAVTTATRWEGLSDVPSMGEALPGYDASGWFGLGAPKNTPTAVIDKLNKEVNVALADPKLKARLADMASTGLAGSPADFGKLIAEDIEKWAKVVKAANIKPE
jgi:tripartite-type tricarboxylate transporter receptor subunit TctC